MITKSINVNYALLPEGRAKTEVASEVYLDKKDPIEKSIDANELANWYILRLRESGVINGDRSYSLKKLEEQGLFGRVMEVKDSAVIMIESYVTKKKVPEATAEKAAAPVEPIDRFLRSRLTKEFRLSPSSDLEVQDSLEIKIKKSKGSEKEGFNVYEVTATATGTRADVFDFNSMVTEEITYKQKALLTA